ncbi:uncharacterized protein LOC123529728 [Mercenaria mercenaria]|uniref:uncharacterized protein LOC123529728 n=1 Tax=Mercenaria mercenaria TaxID=6596 RepID=UPI00234EB5D7|nr:uncharacterized protein LOC123529728 [Mercenaria mercenaria]
MHLAFYCKRTMMAASRRKKVMLYGAFTLVLVVAFLQVTYFNEAYSPLQVLSDARSEARRLLKFITLYHYQCNNTIQGANVSSWPVCLEKSGGLNLVLGGPRIMYSVGPTYDCSLERMLALNFSYSVYIFHHQKLALDFSRSSARNRTKVVKTIIVPNDPADFGRNSYETQTLNNVFELLKHPVVDILKIETVSDMKHSHELLQYIVKDHLLTGVRQLHLSLYIDKVDDDYLYSWYKAFYELFHHEGFRLYHTAASDTLCLQVTLMESCVYYLSWIRDPGPETFILYPPAIDGSESFEEDRLLDYMENTEASCSNDLEVNIPSAAVVTLCMDTVDRNPNKPCQVVLFRSSGVQGSITAIPNSRCSVTTLEIEANSQGEIIFFVKHRRYERSVTRPVTLEEALQKHLPMSHTNLVYIDLNKSFWEFFTNILDSGAFFNVDQIIVDIKKLWGNHRAIELRRRYSELQRIEAYGFRKYQINENKLTFRGKSVNDNDNFKINYLKTATGRSYH